MYKLSYKQKIGLIAAGLVLSMVILEAGMRLAGLALSFMQEHQNRLSIKKNGAYIIICLGGSTTAEEGLNRAHCYPRQLENILNDSNICARFSVINKGVS